MTLKNTFHYPSSSQLTLAQDEWKHPDLTWGEKVFLAEIRSIASHYAENKIPYRSVKMAQHFNVSPMTVNKWLKSLVKQGYLSLALDPADKNWEQLIVVNENK